MAVSLAFACCRVMPRFSRPTAEGKALALRAGLGSEGALNPVASHTSTSCACVLPGFRNPGGSTPAISYGSVVLIALIVSLNIANLLLARASGRQQEMAMRFALG